MVLVVCISCSVQRGPIPSTTSGRTFVQGFVSFLRGWIGLTLVSIGLLVWMGSKREEAGIFLCIGGV